MLLRRPMSQHPCQGSAQWNLPLPVLRVVLEGLELYWEGKGSTYRDAHAIGSEISQAENSLAISQHHHFHIMLWPCRQSLHHGALHSRKASLMVHTSLNILKPLCDHMDLEAWASSRLCLQQISQALGGSGNAAPTIRRRASRCMF